MNEKIKKKLLFLRCRITLKNIVMAIGFIIVIIEFFICLMFIPLFVELCFESF